MSFLSPWFPLFFAAVLAGLAAMRTVSARHAFLLAANLAFYAAGTPWFVLVLLLPATVDYWCALRIEESSDHRIRRQWLVLSIAINLGILAYFKYANFFMDNLAALWGGSAAPLNVVLPIGISFFTFKTMSYTIDVYRGVIPATRSLRDYTMFVSFFPELVAGPIVRASVFMPQMQRTLRVSWRRIRGATPIILLGLTKKLLVADRLAVFADEVFRNPDLYSRGTVATAVVAYAIQIYCDFSGYTDIAIGVARIIGFDLPENFDMPYLSTSITEFWRRWHMTLSSWLRDYLYIPLGGNRKGRLRTYVNLTITMLLGGLWHGASWTFVLWGLYHGIGLAAHKWWRERQKAGSPLPTPHSLLPSLAGWAATFTFTCAGWIFFRAQTLGDAATIFAKIFGPASGGVQWFFLPFWVLLPLVVAAHLAGEMLRRGASPVAAAHSARHSYLLRAMPAGAGAISFLVTVWAIVLYLFVPMQRSPFIYFRF
jgi:alginate O-acetyltransferase complex protein AlgI